MPAADCIDRHTYFPTKHRGFTFRLQANGSKRYYGWIPGRGRVPLDGTLFKAALDEWHELRGKAGNGEKLPKRNVRLRDIEPQWWEIKQRKLSDSTTTEYRDALDLVHLPLFGHRRLPEIDADVLAALHHGLADRGLNYVDHKRPVRPLSRSRVDNIVKPLRGLMGYALRRKLISSNPFDLLTDDDRADDERERFVYEWSDEEIENVLRAAEERDARPGSRQEYAPFIRAAIETGMRLGELTGSDWGPDGLDLEAGFWNVERQWTKAGVLRGLKTKASKRRVPLTPEFVAHMRRYRMRAPHSQDGQPVFPTLGRGGSRSGGGTRLSHRNVQRRAWDPIKQALGLPDKVTFHQLRHAFASRAHARGVVLQDLSMVMGHSSIAVTANVYVHLYGREQAEERFRLAMTQA